MGKRVYKDIHDLDVYARIARLMHLRKLFQVKLAPSGREFYWDLEVETVD